MWLEGSLPSKKIVFIKNNFKKYENVIIWMLYWDITAFQYISLGKRIMGVDYAHSAPYDYSFLIHEGKTWSIPGLTT